MVGSACLGETALAAVGTGPVQTWHKQPCQEENNALPRVKGACAKPCRHLPYGERQGDARSSSSCPPSCGRLEADNRARW